MRPLSKFSNSCLHSCCRTEEIKFSIKPITRKPIQNLSLFYKIKYKTLSIRCTYLYNISVVNPAYTKRTHCHRPQIVSMCCQERVNTFSHLLWTSLEPGHCYCAVCLMELHMNISKPSVNKSNTGVRTLISHHKKRTLVTLKILFFVEQENAWDFHCAEWERETHRKCVSLTRDAWDLAGLVLAGRKMICHGDAKHLNGGHAADCGVANCGQTCDEDRLIVAIKPKRYICSWMSVGLLVTVKPGTDAFSRNSCWSTTCWSNLRITSMSIRLKLSSQRLSNSFTGDTPSPYKNCDISVSGFLLWQFDLRFVTFWPLMTSSVY